MSTIYITQQGAVLRKTGERLRVTYRSTVLLDMPLIHVSQVVIFGKASITAATVALLLEKEIDVCYLTQHGTFLGRLAPAVTKNVIVRRAQYQAAFDPKVTLRVAKGFVIGKLTNMRTTLQRAAREQTSKDFDKAIERLKAAIKQAEKAKDPDQLRGYEGAGSAAYFEVFDGLLKQPEWTFHKRERRPPTDPVNALLSFAYTLLMNDLFAAVTLVGLDPYQGYLHTAQYGRPALPLDLMEEFRPVIADAVVLTCINKQILKRADVEEAVGHVFRLTEAGRQKFVTQYDARKQTEFTHPVLNQKMTYHQCFEQQARFLAKVLHGELAEYPAFLSH